MLVEPVEIHAPVAVITGLALVGPEAAPACRFSAAEILVGIVDDRRDPHRTEAHVADVIGIVDDAFEIAAEVAYVVAFAVRPQDAAVEGRMRAALAALVVAWIAVDETVGEHEIHRFARERLGGAVELVGLRRDTAAMRASGEQDRAEECEPPAHRVAGTN